MPDNAALCRPNSLLKACAIDSYDDLLLPEVRLLAQLPVFASGEHFMSTNFFIIAALDTSFGNCKVG